MTKQLERCWRNIVQPILRRKKSSRWGQGTLCRRIQRSTFAKCRGSWRIPCSRASNAFFRKWPWSDQRKLSERNSKGRREKKEILPLKGTLFNWHLLSSRSRNSLNGRGKSPGRFWGVPWRQLPKSSWTCCSWISAARAFSFLHSEAWRNSGLMSFPEQIPATNQLCMNSTFKICRYFWEAFSCRLIPINDAGLPLDAVFVGNEFMSVIFCRSESCAVDYESDSRQQVVAMESADADRTTGLGGKKRPSFDRGRKFFFF